MDLIPAPFVVTIPASEAHWLVAALAASFLLDVQSFVLTSSRHKHALSLGLQSINLLREAFWVPDGARSQGVTVFLITRCQVQKKFQFPTLQKAVRTSRNGISLDYMRISRG